MKRFVVLISAVLLPLAAQGQQKQEEPKPAPPRRAAGAMGMMPGMMGPGMMGGGPMMPGMMGGRTGEEAEATQGYEVRFYPYDAQLGPFLELLKSTLPPWSRVTGESGQGVLAVHTSTEGHEKVERFLKDLEEVRAEAERKTEAIESAPDPGGILLEVLLLAGLPPGEKGPPAFSLEAKEMGLEEVDLKFLGQKAWKTYGKGAVRVRSEGEFETYVSDCRVRGQIEALEGGRVEMNLALNWEEEEPVGAEGGPPRYRSYGFETQADVTLGQTTLLGTTGHGKDLLLVVRARTGGPAAGEIGTRYQIME